MKWMTQGDANTSYFHSCANRRRRKKIIFSLENERECLTVETANRDHIYKFYKNQFGKDINLNVKVTKDFWRARRRISDVDNDSLVQKFSKEEASNTIKGLSGDSALGPDGFPTCF